MKEYALYNDDEFITIGTTKEIADELGVKEKTIKRLRYPSIQKRTKRVLVEV
ncbi:hypothetical protein [Streptococcus vicugnae]|uniref:hypothetical protein n=1 Tax=Streptococcus vicugnae TaxID=2740579 RepID=UPI0014048F2D|nr:hypothetical protein [Streptococcus vicugnae]